MLSKDYLKVVNTKARNQGLIVHCNPNNQMNNLIKLYTLIKNKINKYIIRAHRR